MTVSYSEHVFTSTSNGIFLKLLFRWKGSIYKLVWRDLVIYVLLYSILSCIYRFMLTENGKFPKKYICYHYKSLNHFLKKQINFEKDMYFLNCHYLSRFETILRILLCTYLLSFSVIVELPTHQIQQQYSSYRSQLPPQLSLITLVAKLSSVKQFELVC